jgi:hypothetical protein
MQTPLAVDPITDWHPIPLPMRPMRPSGMGHDQKGDRMSNTNTGGPAFPHIAQNYSDVRQDGMTLRDYFAAKAMQGDISSFSDDKDPGDVASVIAERAYQIADAMLKAREA